MKTILVVDDSTSILQSIKRILEKEGYTVYTAVTGELAFEVLKTIKPDIILLDLMLPGITGFEVLKKMKNNKVADGIPKIIISSRTEPEDIVNALELGASDYMKKPLDLSELIARINAAMAYGGKKRSGNDTPDIHSKIKAFSKDFNSFEKILKNQEHQNSNISKSLSDLSKELKAIVALIK